MDAFAPPADEFDTPDEEGQVADRLARAFVASAPWYFVFGTFALLIGMMLVGLALLMAAFAGALATGPSFGGDAALVGVAGGLCYGTPGASFMLAGAGSIWAGVATVRAGSGQLKHALGAIRGERVAVISLLAAMGLFVLGGIVAIGLIMAMTPG